MANAHPLTKEELPDRLRFRFDGLVLETDRFDRKDADSVIGLGIHSGPHLIMSYLADHPELARGRRVAEVFSGSGPLGLTALKLGAEHVTFLDINERANQFLRRNLEANGFLPARYAVLTEDIRELDLPGRFDLVLANPPFMPVPEGVQVPVNSGGGFDGNRIFSYLIDRLPGMLQEDGTALIYSLQLEDAQGIPLIQRHIEERDHPLSASYYKMLPSSIPVDILREELVGKAPSKQALVDAWIDRLLAIDPGLRLNWNIIFMSRAPSPGSRARELRAYDGSNLGAGFFPWRFQSQNEIIRNTMLSLIENDDRIFW